MSIDKIPGSKNQLSIAVSIGEPAGIGPDIILAAWQARAQNCIGHFTVIGDVSILKDRAHELNIDVEFTVVENGIQAFKCRDTLPVLQTRSRMHCKAGKPKSGNSRGVIEAIESGVVRVIGNEFCALVTCPINKKALYDAGFDFPGHTEFLSQLASQNSGKKFMPVMMLAGPQLRSVPVTIHMALCEVKNVLSQDLIIKTVEITARDLREKFGISEPVLAIAGVNPHAGEEGAMGREEIEFIAPAVDILRDRGLNILGPLPADTMFHDRARAQYDVAICMYHDQALIPVKTLGFDDGVNVTLGLPFIRTSPDHGTAYDLAGTGQARPDSFIAALKMARDMVEHQGNRT